MNDGLTLDTRKLDEQLEQLSEKALTKVEKKALKKGVLMIAKKAKESLRQKVKGANRKNPQYIDTLSSGVRTSVIEQEDATMLAKVHIMGTRKTGSGTYRLRFFETGTTRYKKDGSLYGINRGKNKYQFFDDAYSQSSTKATEALFNELNKSIEEING